MIRARLVRVVAVLAIVASACGTAHVNVDATATTTPDPSSLPLTYSGGQTRFDPPGEVSPRMTAEHARDASKGSWPQSNSEPAVLFALYTNYGQGKMLDNGLVAPSFVNHPVWVVRFQNVVWSSSGGSAGGVAGHGPHSTGPTAPPVTAVTDAVIVVDDASGASLVDMREKPDSPPASPRSTSGADPKPSSCPEDLSIYAPGLSSAEGTPLPTGMGHVVTQPHAIITASDGDVYQVWGGVGSIEHPLTGPADEAPDGVLIVTRAPADPCKNRREDEGGIVFHDEPSHSGIVTVTAIAHDTVDYRTARGDTGTYNVVTERFR